ncbi:MAG: NADH-quinone oxidoreductase subunit C [Devosia sp.]|uniref:NADH-quinone oxidoreductase subunit C n=1 Tax=Devosia sp. TaxID=1871048 RepID=UPI001A5620BA|nr:NADH-quinone oxidoreductase subunit C [Devosia sp.]MBL8597446.1 NADH-quinone oxidoreductase subunit C [Devosia sp.]
MGDVTSLTPLQALEQRARALLGDRIEESAIAQGELTLTVHRETIVDSVRMLHDDPELRFVSFIDVCGVDYPEREERFEVVYHLLSPYKNQRIRLKVHTDDEVPVPSITPVFPGADWFEREAYDFYGILFSGHPDLRRILTDYGFDGHPLRKDFPTTGYVEVRYDEERKRVVYEPVKLAQEFRQFDYLSPWEGTDYVLPGDEKKSQ